MIYVKYCETYDKETVLKHISEIFDKADVLNGVKGLNIAVKPNLIGKKKPESAATTHPSIVWAVCKLLKDAGANVVIADSPGGFYEPGLLRGVYKATGMEAVAAETGAELNFDTSETEVENTAGKYLKKLKIITPLAKADRIINLAKFKTHGMMTYTGAVKNLFGSIAGLEKAEYHFQLSDYDEFADCIIDIFLANSPVFNIIDGIVGMHKDGPTAGEPYNLNTILAGSDAFELDFAAAWLVKADYRRIPVLKQAALREVNDKKLLNPDIDAVSVCGDELFQVNDFIVKYNDSLKKLHFADGIFGRLLTNAVKPRPVFIKDKCRGCLECVKCCPAKVITPVKADKTGKTYMKVDLNGCIRCYCCQELCPFKVIKIKRPLLNKLVIKRNENK